MVVVWAFAALVAGFAAMAVMMALATAVLGRLVPEWTEASAHAARVSTGYIAVNLGYSFAAAMVGGYVTAWMARNNPMHLVLALALVVLALSALSAVQTRGKTAVRYPIWFQLMLVSLTPLGVFVGGLARLRVMGL